MFYQETVNSSGLLQLLVTSKFDNLPIGDDCDDVSLLDGAQPVSDHQHSPVLANLIQSVLKVTNKIMLHLL